MSSTLHFLYEIKLGKGKVKREANKIVMGYIEMYASPDTIT